jgi:hypothetical protein
MGRLKNSDKLRMAEENEESKDIITKKKLFYKDYDMEQYDGAESLGNAEFNEKGEFIKNGKPKFFINGTKKTGFKLIMRYKSKSGIKSALVDVIKPKHKLYDFKIEYLKGVGIQGLN